MERVIVTVKLADEARVRDVELPTSVPVAQLARVLASRFGWSQESTGQQIAYDVEVHPPGRRLNPKETLAQANVWDGAWLVFHPRALSADPQTPKLDLSWEPLDLQSPKTASKPETSIASPDTQLTPASGPTPPPASPAPKAAPPGTSTPQPDGGSLQSSQAADSPVIDWVPLDPPPSRDTASEPRRKPPPHSDVPRGWRRIDDQDAP